MDDSSNEVADPDETNVIDVVHFANPLSHERWHFHPFDWQDDTRQTPPKMCDRDFGEISSIAEHHFHGQVSRLCSALLRSRSKGAEAVQLAGS